MSIYFSWFTADLLVFDAGSGVAAPLNVDGIDVSMGPGDTNPQLNVDKVMTRPATLPGDTST